MKTGKDEIVRVVLEAVLISPDDLDLQITALGLAHEASWLPNRKKVLWQSFAVDSEQWANRCVERITTPSSDVKAVCALLNAHTLTVLKSVQAYSPDLVCIWDVNGAETCGIGLARQRPDWFDHYFYVGWKPGQETVQWVDYIPRIQTPPGQGGRRLDWIDGPCHVTGGCWAELPYRFGYLAGTHEFAGSTRNLAAHGFTQTVRRQLGYDGGAGAA